MLGEETSGRHEILFMNDQCFFGWSYFLWCSSETIGSCGVSFGGGFTLPPIINHGSGQWVPPIAAITLGRFPLRWLIMDIMGERVPFLLLASCYLGLWCVVSHLFGSRILVSFLHVFSLRAVVPPPLVVSHSQHVLLIRQNPQRLALPKTKTSNPWKYAIPKKRHFIFQPLEFSGVFFCTVGAGRFGV